MTLVLYEPEGPALEFIGHAGAGLYGQDPVCAALSMLLYTLIRAVPQARVHAGDGYCRVDCAPRPAPAPGGDAPEASGNSTRFDTAMRDVELSQSPPIRIPAQRIRIGKEKEGSIVQLSPTGGSGTVRASFDVVLGGLELLAESFPAHVRLQRRNPGGSGRQKEEARCTRN